MNRLTYLVTAGPTREFFDPIRFISNASSGKMGFAIAAAACKRGGRVILVTGPTHLEPPNGAQVVHVISAEEMKGEVMTLFDECDVTIMTAAVVDWRPKVISEQKLKKRADLRVKLVRTPDILKALGEKKGDKFLVGFAAETENVLANAKEKLREKNLDMIVANDVSAKDTGFASDYCELTIFSRDGTEYKISRKKKTEAAEILLDFIDAQINR